MTRQHQPLRVPNGWSNQDKALVIQLERLLDELYALISRLEEVATEDEKGLMSAADKTKLDGITPGAGIEDIEWDGANGKLTKTINGTASDVVTAATIQSALGSFTWGALAGETEE